MQLLERAIIATDARLEICCFPTRTMCTLGISTDRLTESLCRCAARHCSHEFGDAPRVFFGVPGTRGTRSPMGLCSSHAGLQET